MGSIESIERYLRAHLAGFRTGRPDSREPGPHPFVTISRQAGAGGHSLATAMLDVFGDQPEPDIFAGWQVFDQKLCEIVATDPVCAKSLDALLAEEYRRPTDDFFQQMLRLTIDQDVVMARVFEVVRALASIGKAIIVGRGGSEVTRDMDEGVHLRIVAPEPERIRRVMDRHGVDERRAINDIRRLDRHRARLLKTHFRVDIDDPTHYDAVWNTGSASIEDIAVATAAVLRRRVAAEEAP